jgi:hypothetical protein
MLTLVTVKMKITKVDGTPWKKGIVKFLTVNESFTSTDQIPSESEISVKLDILGIGETKLWAEDEGELETYYKCILPNSKEFTFSIPIPGLTVYELSQLRLGGIQPSDPEYQSIIDYINTYLGGLTDYLPTGGIEGDVLKIIQTSPRVVGWKSDEIPVFIQITPSTRWTYNHNLNRIPIAQVTDLNNNLKIADIEISETQVIVKSVNPTIGKIIIR